MNFIEITEAEVAEAVATLQEKMKEMGLDQVRACVVSSVLFGMHAGADVIDTTLMMELAYHAEQVTRREQARSSN